MSPSRRTLLKSGLVAPAVSVAGCSSITKAIGWAPGIDDLDLGTTVVSQPTEQAPGQVKLTLTNTASGSATVLPGGHGGLPLEFIEPMSGDEGRVILFPQDTQNVMLYLGELPDTPSDGCWRIIEDERGDAYLGRVSAVSSTEVKPNKTYSVTQTVYYQGPESVCFPDGRYEVTTSVQLGRGGNAPEKQVRYVLSVAANGSLSIAIE